MFSAARLQSLVERFSEWLNRAQHWHTYLDVVNLLVSGVNELSPTVEKGSMEKDEKPPVV